MPRHRDAHWPLLDKVEVNNRPSKDLAIAIGDPLTRVIHRQTPYIHGSQAGQINRAVTENLH
jgi:hypothetical protein